MISPVRGVMSGGLPWVSEVGGMVPVLPSGTN